VAFAEALVVEGNAHSYVNLLDRLADDYEVLFEGPMVVSLASIILIKIQIHTYRHRHNGQDLQTPVH
jgi:hypothetical protein